MTELRHQENGLRSKEQRTRTDEGNESLFTPSSRVELARNYFSGIRFEYRYDDHNTEEILLRRRVIQLEDLVKDLMARLRTVEKDNEIIKAIYRRIG